MSRAEQDANGRVEQLILLTDHLTGIMRREIATLAARRPSELSSIQAEKSRLAASYTREAEALGRDNAVLAVARAELKSLLKERTREFREVLDTLNAALTRRRRVSEGIVRAIAEEVNATRNPPTYGKNWKPPAQPARAIPITLDQRV